MSERSYHGATSRSHKSLANYPALVGLVNRGNTGVPLLACTLENTDAPVPGRTHEYITHLTQWCV